MHHYAENGKNDRSNCNVTSLLSNSGSALIQSFGQMRNLPSEWDHIIRLHIYKSICWKMEVGLCVWRWTHGGYTKLALLPSQTENGNTEKEHRNFCEHFVIP